MAGQHYDYIIIGGGVIGSSVAFHLASTLKASGRSGEQILVLEKEATIGMGSTGRSAAGVRQQFSTQINIEICKRSVQMLETFERDHNQEIDFRQTGYLFMLNHDEQVESFRHSFALWENADLPVEWLEPDDIKERYPFLHTDDLLAGTFCPTDGSVDPAAINYGYHKSALKLGVEYRFNTEVEAINTDAGAVSGVVTNTGEEITTNCVINCAGPYLREVGTLCGLDIPADPIRRHCFVTEIIEDGKWNNIPMCVDMRTGLYFRGESGGLLLGLANPMEPAGFNFDVDHDILESIIDALDHRAPALCDTEIRRGWAGMYSTSADHQAIIGPVEEIDGFIVCGGFSGHGIMQAPAAAESLANYIVHGSYGPIDLEPLEMKRFLTAELHVEQNVI